MRTTASEGFYSHKVMRLRRSPWGIGCSSVGMMLCFVAFAGLASTRDPSVSFLWSMVGLVAMMMAGLFLNSWRPQRETTRVRANKQGAWIGDEFIRCADILEAIVLPGSEECSVRLLRRGMHLPLELVLEDEESAHRLVRALGHDAIQKIRDLEIGSDGILVGPAGRERYVHYANVEDVSAGENDPDSRTVKVTLRGGQIVEIPCRGRGSEAQVAFVVRRIRHAVGAFARSESTPDSSVLARGGRPLRDWIAHLRALGLGSEATHRTAPVVPERLWRVLEDPRTLPSMRAAAAVALGPSLAAGERARLRTVAGSTTAPKLRIALEAAADPEKDAELEAILAEVEPEDRGTSAV